MDDYTVDSIKRTWFSAEPVGEINTSPHIESDSAGLPEIKVLNVLKTIIPAISISGSGCGHLIGAAWKSLITFGALSIFQN